MMRPFALLAVLLLFAGPAAAAGPDLAGPDLAGAVQPRPGDRAWGDPKAPVTIVEYASLTCPHCAAFHTGTLPALKARWIDTGKVRLVYRDYPLDQGALVGAVIAQCITPEAKSLEFVSDLFGTQHEWAHAPQPMAALAAKAEKYGIDRPAFDKCIDDKDKLNNVVAPAKEAAEKYNVESTPSFIVGGKLVSGEMSPAEFDALLKPLVK